MEPDSTPSSSPSGETSSNPYVQLGLINPNNYDAQNEPGYGMNNQPTDLDAQDQAPKEPPKVDWNSSENPFKSQVEELQARLKGSADPNPKQTLDFRIKELELQSQQAMLQFEPLIAQGKLPREVANTLVTLAKENLRTQYEREAERNQLLPAAKLMTAQDIAKRHSTKTFQIKPEDLMNEATPESMQTRAKMMVEFQRDSGFKQRRDSGADRVEGGAGTAMDSRAIDSLSAHSKIALGVRRGQK